MTKLKVGFILDEGSQTNLIFDLIERSRKSEYYSIEYLIVQKIRNHGKPNFKKYKNINLLIRLFNSLFFSLIIKFEKRSLLKHKIYFKQFNIYKLDTFNIPIIEVNPKISKSGFVFEYSNEDISKITKLDLDLLIRGGSGILRGEILNLCRFGILSLHHGNNDFNRGGPPGFWEVFHRIPETGFIIQRLCADLDGGDVFVKGAIPTSISFLLNLVKIQIIANIYFDKLLNLIGKENALPQAYPKKPYSYDLYKLPSLKVQCSYLFKTFSYKISNIVSKKLGYNLNWAIAYSFNDNWENLEFRKFKKIKNPPNRFYADPFVFCQNGLNICFVEDYDYGSAKGKITAIEITTKGYVELGTAIEESFHMSYPFIFRNGVDLFMCPETHQIGEIRLYKCVDFPLKWEFYKTLIKDISASDTNIFYLNNKWWMLANIDTAEVGDHCSELFLFFSDSFDSENWVPHPLNPIVFSSLRARNAGLVFQDENIYRVFQVQGFDNYGESMGVAKIIEISEHNYKEELIFDIKPFFFKNLRGTHTFSAHSSLFAVDYSKIEKIKK
jgi:hypothetical protein